MDNLGPLATPESFFSDKSVAVYMSCNGIIVDFALPCRGQLATVSPVGVSEPEDVRFWRSARHTYSNWPDAQRAIDFYMSGSPDEIIGMAKVAFFEREADMIEDPE